MKRIYDDGCFRIVDEYGDEYTWLAFENESLVLVTVGMILTATLSTKMADSDIYTSRM